MRRAATAAKPTIFLTLTIKKGLFTSPSAQAVELAKGWRMLRQYLMRQLGWKHLPFMIVIEKHKSGWPHAHILLRTTYIDHKLIRAWWIERFASPIIDIRRIRGTAQAAHYVSKYLSKSPHAFDGVKRYWQSRDFQLQKPVQPPKTTGSDVFWKRSGMQASDIARFAYADGARITWFGSRLVVEGWHLGSRAAWGFG